MEDMTSRVTELAERYPQPEEFVAALLAEPGQAAAPGKSLLQAGEILRRQGNMKLAQPVLKGASEADDRGVKAQALAGLGVVFFALGEFDQALAVLRESLAVAEADADWSLAARCQTSMGAVHDCRSDFARAIRCHEAALAAARRAHDRAREAAALSNLGVSLMHTGSNRRALSCFEQAAPVMRELGNRRAESACYHNIGAAYEGMGNLSRSLEWARKSLEIDRELGDVDGQASCNNNIADLLLGLGEPAAAIAQAQAALTGFSEVGNRQGMAKCHGLLGLAYKTSGQLDKAAEHEQEGLKIARELGYRAGVATMYDDLGEIHLARGDYAQARECFEQGRRIKAEIGARASQAFSYVGLGRVYQGLGRTAEGEEHLRTASRLVNEMESVDEQRGLFAELGDAHLSAQRYEAAAEHYSRAVSLLEAMRVESVPAEHRRSFWRSNVELFDGLVTTDVRRGQAGPALAHSEQGKGRTIPDMLLAREIGAGGFRPKTMNSAEIVELARTIGKTTIMLRVTPHATYAFTATPEGATGVLEVPDFTAERLETLVLAVHEGRPAGGWFGSYAAYKTSQTEAGELTVRGRYDEAAEKLHSSQQSWFSTMDGVLQTLSDELMARVFESVEPGSPVVLVPNRALNILPLHACLRTVNGRKRYLLQDYEITYAPSCSMLDLCYRRDAALGKRRPAGDSLFAVANPSPPYELVFSEWEVDEIGKHFAQKEVLVKAESKPALLERGRDASVIHLSTHGVHDLGSSFNSRLKLGKDADLTLEEVFEHLRLNRNWLVCLSACESGLLDYRDIADEFIGLQAGFLYAGAPTVIASLWSIADYTTALVMMKLYENIFQHGQTKSSALRNAQLWLMNLTAGEALRLLRAKEETLQFSERIAREDVTPLRRAISLEDPDARPFSHPYSWAGYQLFGV